MAPKQKSWRPQAEPTASAASQNKNRRQRFRPDDHEHDPSQKLSMTSKAKKKRPKKNTDDDTPKAFARLMRWTATGYKPNGLDNGDATKTKKRKRDENDDNAAVPAPTSAKVSAQVQTDISELRLLPGEKMSDFSRRVDAAIPVSLKGVGNTKKLKKKPAPTTADEDFDNWDFDDNGDPVKNPTPSLKKAVSGGNNANKRIKRQQRSPSPFAELKNKRPKQTSINEVVQAPPSFDVKPKNLLRDKVNSVPKASGSLAKREILASERMGILERYHAMMDAKKEVV